MSGLTKIPGKNPHSTLTPTHGFGGGGGGVCSKDTSQGAAF